MIYKHLKITMLVALGALIVPVVPAEATRRHAIRPQIVVPPPAAPEDRAEPVTGGAGAAAPEAEDRESMPQTRRGLLEILFGSGADVLARPSDEVEMDGRMFDAVRLAERSARSSSIDRCWRYVKRALKKAGVVDCYPRTAFAKQAAVELPERYGFKEIEVTDPFDAPVGSVLVYGGRGAGHVELRTETGFVSDHASLKPSPRPLIGVFIKPLEG